MLRNLVVTATLQTVLVLAQVEDELRDLQSAPSILQTNTTTSYSSTTKALKFYGDDIKIAWAASLGCGACITGGYTYCLYGKEGDDFTSKVVSETCCKDSTAANCPQLSSSLWTCSNTYADKTLAKDICPRKAGACGPKTLIPFQIEIIPKYDQTYNATVKLLPGDTCSYQIQIYCGLPTFWMNTTTGFDIEYVDYL